ncbi:MAG: nuclear transport factor 2 family protein [Thiotrichaceae bacterium]|nr:nuclear transport factor 2 family protein [Thiotrichaceae bacterium]
MDQTQALRFAEQWVNAWNQHDLEAVLAHYTEDFSMTTPMIQKLTGDPAGTLQGKAAVGEYWRTALKNIPDLQFKIIAVTSGVDSVSIYYHSVMGKVAIETFFFNTEGKVYKALANYA